MPSQFPTLEDGQVCRYPVQRNANWLTKVNQFVDFSEQRWVSRLPLAAFVFQYNNISRADMIALRDFFEIQKGSYDTFTIEFDGQLYEDMVFDQDDFAPQETKPDRYSLSLKLKQTRPSGILLGYDGNPVYPTIANGVMTQKPWTPGEAYSTNKVDLEIGIRYADYWLENPLRRFVINYPVITDEERIKIENFFHAMHGRMKTFKFVDPDPPNTEYPKCRFDMDELLVEYKGPNHNSLRVQIAEFK